MVAIEKVRDLFEDHLAEANLKRRVALRDATVRLVEVVVFELESNPFTNDDGALHWYGECALERLRS